MMLLESSIPHCIHVEPPVMSGAFGLLRLTPLRLPVEPQKLRLGKQWCGVGQVGE